MDVYARAWYLTLDPPFPLAKTVLMLKPPLADEDAFVAEVEEYAALGVSEVEVMPDRHPVEFTERVAERILPRLAGIGPA